MPHRLRTETFFYLLILCLFFGIAGIPASAAEDASKEGVFRTPVTRDILDNSAFTQWVDGEESPVTRHYGISAVLNTRNSTCDYQGLEFGLSKNIGPRHLRIPLTEKIPVGTITVRGTGTPSVLRSDFPEDAAADLAKNTIWIPGRRISGREQTVSEDGVGRDHFTLWVFPPGTESVSRLEDKSRCFRQSIRT